MKFSANSDKASVCIICGGSDFQVLGNNDRYHMGIRTVGCKQCGFIFSDPKPEEEDLKHFYESDYRQYYQSTNNPDEQYIKKYFKSERLKYTASIISREVRLLEGNRILDIGCSEGILLKELLNLDKGVEVNGIEPSVEFSKYAATASDIRIYHTISDLLEKEKKKYDLIILNHVMEHFYDPSIELMKIRNVLNHNGKIYIDVPNAKEYSSANDLHIAHLYHFTQNSLINLLHSNGYKVIKIEPHSPPHHPASIYCIASINNDSKYTQNRVCDQEAWPNVIKASNEADSLVYRIKFKIRRNKIAWTMIKFFRRYFH